MTSPVWIAGCPTEYTGSQVLGLVSRVESVIVSTSESRSPADLESTGAGAFSAVAGRNGLANWIVIAVSVASVLAFRNEDSVSAVAKAVAFAFLLSVGVLQLVRGVPRDTRVPAGHLAVLGLLLIVLSGGVSMLNSVPFTDWALDIVAPASALLAFPAAFFIAGRVRPEALEKALIASAIISGFSYAAYWLSIRRIAIWEGFAGLATWYLPLAAAVFVWARPSDSRLGKAAFVVGIATLLVSSGSRLAAVPVALLMLYPILRQIVFRRRSTAKFIKSAVLIVVVAVALVAVMNSVKSLGLSVGADRFLSGVQFASSGASDDLSFIERRNQNDRAVAGIQTNPWLGVGPGWTYTWPTPSGTIKSSVIAEAPAGVFADYGLIGGSVLYLYLLALGARSTLRVRSGAGGAADETIAVLVIAAVINGFVASPFDDKGLAIALVLLLALAVCRAPSNGQPDKDMARERAGRGCMNTGLPGFDNSRQSRTSGGARDRPDSYPALNSRTSVRSRLAVLSVRRKGLRRRVRGTEETRVL